MELFWRIFRFGIVGVATAILYFGLLYLFVEVLGINAVLGSSVVYIIVLCFNYLMHYSWTFTASATHTTTLKRYLFMTVCGFVINGSIMLLGVNCLGLNYVLVQIVSMTFIVLWNFTISLLWVYRD